MPYVLHPGPGHKVVTKHWKNVNFFIKYHILLSLTLSVTLSVLLNSEFMRIEPVRDNRVSYLSKSSHFLSVLSMIWHNLTEWKVDALYAYVHRLFLDIIPCTRSPQSLYIRT